MQKTITNSQVQGSVVAPSSKSFMQRALAIVSLVDGPCTIINPSYCEDALAAIQVLKHLGHKVEKHTDKLIISPASTESNTELNFGESGLALRLFTPILALRDHEYTLNAEGSLLKRPADFMKLPLTKAGVRFSSTNGFPPLKVQGPFSGFDLDIDGSLSSQFLSGLLIALPKAHNNSRIRVANLKSIPYVYMTIETIKAFGVNIDFNDDMSEFLINGNQNYRCSSYTIEGDWSGAAGLLVAGAVSEGIEVHNLNSNSTQADKAVLQAISLAGCQVFKESQRIKITPAKQLNAFSFDAEHCPDLFPVLCALAANCKGVSQIKGVHRLKHKESDRGAALVQEFEKLGISCWVEEDVLLVEGGTIKGTTVYGHNDHRIAMAMAIAGLNATAPVTITGAECINKTYPAFYTDLSKLGADIH